MAVSSPKRPGRLWFFFWGRKRSGFPGLLVAVLVAVGLLGLLYASPLGVQLSRWALLASIVVLMLLIAASLVLVGLALFSPRRRR